MGREFIEVGDLRIARCDNELIGQYHAGIIGVPSVSS